MNTRVLLDETGKYDSAILSLAAEQVWPHLDTEAVGRWLRVEPPFDTRYFVLVDEGNEVLGAAVYEIYDSFDDGSVDLDLAFCCIDEGYGKRFLRKLFVESFAAIRETFDVAALQAAVDCEEAAFWRGAFPDHPDRVEVVLVARGHRKIFFYVPIERTE